MFSERLGGSLNLNRLSHNLQIKREAGEDIFDLTESNPTRVDLKYAEKEILSYLADPRALIYRPTPRGLETTRRAVTRYYNHRGRDVRPEDIYLTAGTSEAYSFLFKVLANAGDQVLIPRPSYPLFDYLAALESVEAISYPMIYDGSWSIDWNELEGLLAPRARALLVVHPGNPTGAYLKRKELDNLVDFCRRRSLALIVDEVFIDYPFTEEPERAGSLAGAKEVLSFVLSGLSKVAALPQIKLAWISIGGPEKLRLEAGQRLEHVADLFLSVSAAAQQVGDRLVELAAHIQPAITTRLAAHYAYLQQATADSPVSVLRAEGGWTAILRCPAVLTSEEWALELLSSDNVYVHPGYLFDLPVESSLVVSLLPAPDSFRSGIRRLLRRVEERS
jgi:hypothetical protein